MKPVHAPVRLEQVCSHTDCTASAGWLHVVLAGQAVWFLCDAHAAVVTATVTGEG